MYLRRFKITIKETALASNINDGVRRLLDQQEITVEPFVLETLHACSCFGNWGGDQNRTFVVTLEKAGSVESVFVTLNKSSIERFEFV